MTVESLLRQAEALAPDERRELAARLLESADTADGPPLTAAQAAELDRRIADADANPGSGIPWEVVYAESLKRVRS